MDNNVQSTPWYRKIKISRILLYGVLFAYALVSVLPFLVMLSTSLMTLGEANSGRFLPSLGDDSDITNCIVYRREEVFNEEGVPEIKTHFVIDVAPEAEQAQYPGFRSTTVEPDPTQEDIFSIPFFTNYCGAWEGGDLGRYMLNTVRITAIQVVGTVIFVTLASYAFARMEFVGRELIFAILLATLMIPAIVQNLPNFLTVTEIGRWFGASGLGLCGEKANCWINNWPALTIPFMATAVSIFLLRQHFATIPDELWDAARMDGSGHVRFLIQIVLPISKAALFVVILFAFIAAWNDLAWPLLVTNGPDWRPISVGLQSFFDGEQNFPNLRMAGAMIAILPILLLYAVTQRTFIEGLSQSGLKG
ncbi:MAG: carbohydrate ABC transporter permease [Anaerolineae bacterium]|nr:carbohydrate ABC transporter permease [Anaerolineae bacterium]MCO5205448.1 carbohydrate ABC transporter permease [Anaerolineae bacterium]